MENLCSENGQKLTIFPDLLSLDWYLWWTPFKLTISDLPCAPTFGIVTIFHYMKLFWGNGGDFQNTDFFLIFSVGLNNTPLRGHWAAQSPLLHEICSFPNSARSNEWPKHKIEKLTRGINCTLLDLCASSCKSRDSFRHERERGENEVENGAEVWIIIACR